MLSKQEQLEHRGHLDEGAEADYAVLSLGERIELVQGNVPKDRTLGARLLQGYCEEIVLKSLIKALAKEKKLYSKIEICNTLSLQGENAVKPLIEVMGQVGNNQHKIVSEKEFKKDSYPLPRDIASRTLIRMGAIALPDLLEVLNTNDKKKISEAIDAIGFICFYDYNADVFTKLKVCYLNNSADDLIKWKIIRAMSSFPESGSFLLDQKQQLRHERLLKEIDRSLRLIKKH